MVHRCDEDRFHAAFPFSVVHADRDAAKRQDACSDERFEKAG